MHELALCRGLLGQVERIAVEHGARGVGRILLRVGPLAGVEPHLLGEAFRIARMGTVASAADLAIEIEPLRVRCLTCGVQSEATPSRLLCGSCGEWRTQVVSGDALLLASVELIFDEHPAEAPARESDHV